MSEEVKAGHWATPEGAEMAQRYASKTREQIPNGDVTDFELANRIFMADRGSLELIGYQTAAKERIRWLSAHLAATEARAEAAEARVGELEAREQDAFDAGKRSAVDIIESIRTNDPQFSEYTRSTIVDILDGTFPNLVTLKGTTDDTAS